MSGESLAKRSQVIGTASCELIRKIVKEEGFGHLLSTSIAIIRKFVVQIVARPRFYFDGQWYKYAFHIYGKTWENERAVELPIVVSYLQQRPSARILEVGNVLSHYTRINHTCVDKYERGRGVVNTDIVEYQPEAKFDLIICISTIEHIGVDDDPGHPWKVKQAIEKMISLLTEDGEIMMTFPIGYNLALDEIVRQGQYFTKARYLVRTTSDNQWRQVNYSSVKDSLFGSPFPFANALVVAGFEFGSRDRVSTTSSLGRSKLRPVIRTVLD
jgi:hypothetical protein